jgi:DNA-binding beta-propeller fold protein YncE
VLLRWKPGRYDFERTGLMPRDYLAFVVAALATLAISAPGAAQVPFAAFDRASAPVLNDPHDLAFGPDGRLYVANKFGNEIVILDPKSLAVIGTFGDGALYGVHDTSFGPDGRAYVAATGLNAIVVFRIEASGEAVFERSFGPFSRPEGALAHSNGRLYVMASGTGELLALDGEKTVARVGGLFGAHDVAQALDGSIWVADNNNSRLVQFSPDLEQLAVLEGPEFGFVGPRYLDVDDFGRLIVADQDAHRVLLIDPVARKVLGVIGDGKPGFGVGVLNDPEGVAVRGNAYYFADSDNNRIVKYVVLVN